MTRAPAAMTPQERLAEIAAILAVGYRRILQKRLDEGSQSLALCCTPVNGPEKEATS